MLSEKIRLYPTQEQEVLFRQFLGTARFVYNTCLAYKMDTYNYDGYSCTTKDLVDYMRELKYSGKYDWLKDIPDIVTKIAINDLDNAYKLFFKRGNKGFPRFKKKDVSNLSFGTRADGFRQVDAEHIKITGIKEPIRIRWHNQFPKIYNPRVSYDGNYWYFSYAYEVDVKPTQTSTSVLGVDLGVKNLAVVTNGTTHITIPNINKTKKVKQLEKRKKHLQRQISNKYEISKKGIKYVKTKNIERLQKLINSVDRRLKNIRDNYLHTFTSKLVKAKPAKICMEDLNVAGMMKNKHLSKAIQQQGFYKFRQYLSYKCELNGIQLIIANRFYPSSKLCSHCGEKKANLSLSERTYICDKCGTVMDRDINAALNLRNYALAH